MADETRLIDGRSRLRLVLVVCCVVAAVITAFLVPTLASGGLAGSPIDSALPGERFDDGGGSGGSGGSGGGFGALNPGDQTGVGGETGFDNDTFGANDTEVHFEVESTETAYWRTGTYDTYTGTGWERDSHMERYDPPLDPVGLTDGELEFEITLAEPATAVPTAWQPRRVSGADGLAVTEDGAVRANEALESGTTITGVSQLQENDIDVLQAAGEDYPADVAEQYTQLPADTPDRVGELTAELTADDETPYETAVTVQNWLRNEKGYSLQADERSDNIADTFIFEMEEGYCEYFATAMTTMLRSQDIPTRYAVGYTTGQPVGENTYEVRGMNAHAWVEVYFPDVGWVQFDPTPGDNRLDTQSAVLEEDVGEEFDLEEPGSPGETFEPGNISQQNDTENDTEDDESDGRFDISLNRTAVPGLPVEIIVTEDGEPAVGMNVTVNDEPVGVTDSDGTVTMTVPEDDELEISVQWEFVDMEGNESQWGSGDHDDSRTFGGGGGGYAPTLGTVAAGTTPFVDEEDEEGTIDEEDEEGTTDEGTERQSDENEPIVVNGTVPIDLGEEANTTVQVETGATLSVAGETLPGETVTVTATVSDVAISDASVTLDGEHVGTTDENGRAEVTLPEAAGETTLEVERGAVSGEETVTIPELELAVETGTLPLPFTTVTATVSAGDTDVAGAPVSIGGEQVGTTGADGTADVRLPLSSGAIIETSMYGMSDSETVDGLLLNLGLVAAGGVLFVAVPIGIARRRKQSLEAVADGAVSSVVNSVSWLVTATQLALLAGVRHGGSWLGSVPGRVRTTLVYLFDTLRGRIELGELRRLLVAWFAAKRRAVRSVGQTGNEPGSENVAGDIQQAWSTFLTHVSISEASVQTPGEIATHAIERDGLPAEPVEALLNAFRAVEYGSRPANAQRDRAQQAIARLEAHRDGEEQGDYDGSDQRGTQYDPPVEEVTADGGVRTGEHHRQQRSRQSEHQPSNNEHNSAGGSE